MLLLILSCFFLYLALHEGYKARNCVDGFNGASKIYVSICLFFVILTAWTPIKKIHFEHFLSKKATLLAGTQASVHCNTAFDSIFDNKINVIGHANPDTGDIVFQLSWCDKLMDYLDNPFKASRTVRYSLMLFTHEVMHIRGELNEQKTECQAIQRNHIAGELLGISKAVALEHTLDYFKHEYPRHPYFSEQCGPGKAMDEELVDRLW